MGKDFEEWHTVKSALEEKLTPTLFREQEIWWCSLGMNVGIEQDGKNSLFERPVLVIRKFNKEMFWGIPLTSQNKEGIFYYSFPLQGMIRTVILSQLRTLSAKRLIRRLGKTSDKQFGIIQNVLTMLIKPTDPLRGPRVPNGNL